MARDTGERRLSIASTAAAVDIGDGWEGDLIPKHLWREHESYKIAESIVSGAVYPSEPFTFSFAVGRA